MSDENLPANVNRTMANLPAVSGEQYQHMGKYAGALVLACFEQIGGLSRMAEWADGNPTDFFTKLFPKVIQRSTAVDVSGSVTIDDAINRLENAEYEDVEAPLADEGQFYDL